MRWRERLFVVAAAEVAMAVRGRAFIIGIMFAPVMMAAAIGFQRVSQNRIDKEDRRFAVIDHSGVLYLRIADLAREWNETIARRGASGLRENDTAASRILPEPVQPAGTEDDVKRALVDRVKRKELKAFIEIPADVLRGGPDSRVRYYSNDATETTLPRWVETNVTRAALTERFKASSLDFAEATRLTRQVPMSRLDLPTWDERGVARESAVDPARAVGIPILAMLLLWFAVLGSAPPLMQGVLEEKQSRTSEVMLGSVTPFEFMGGKLLGSTTVSLIVAGVYMTSAFIVAQWLGYVDVIGVRLIAVFVTYVIAAALLYGSVFISIGAACSDFKDSQAMMMPAMILIMLPVFAWPTVLRAPTGALAVAISLIPTATPFIMLPLSTNPPGPPVWQQIVGLCLTIATAVLFVWAAGRIFRVGILMQGKSATPAEMLRWVRKA